MGCFVATRLHGGDRLPAVYPGGNTVPFSKHFKSGTGCLMEYEHAIVKFEGDVAILLCNGCGIKITEGTSHEDREHYCTMCMSGNCKAKFKKGN